MTIEQYSVPAEDLEMVGCVLVFRENALSGGKISSIELHEQSHPNIAVKVGA